MGCYEKGALERSAVKVELSRAATALLHSEAALTPGDLTRAGTARGLAAAAASDLCAAARHQCDRCAIATTRGATMDRQAPASSAAAAAAAAAHTTIDPQGTTTCR